MTNENQLCPDRELFVEFLSGKLDETRLESVVTHLEECDVCGDTIRAMNVDDTFLELLRIEPDESESDSESDDPRLGKLLTELENLSDFETAGTDAPLTPKDDLQARVHEVQTQLVTAEDDNEIGRLAHYRILRLLGAGGMGVVYLAEDTRLKRNVALKILRPSLGLAARERFVQEAQAAAAIEHDNVVTIYNVGSVGPLAYLAMQFLDGETLESHLQERGKLDADEATNISAQIAEGLAAAHAKKLIHRDIKPANILISQSGRATLLDFGLAYAVDDNPQLTETGMIAGTPAYMSPEQAQGRSVDERSDLFSLGTVMYRMLTGETPFTGKNALATILSIQRDDPTSPRQADITVPATLSDTVMDLLEKEPRDRPESALTVAEALRKGERPPTRKVTIAQTSSNMKSGNGWRAIATLLAMGGLIAAATIYVILTDKGKIIVETDDPNIQVKVIQDEQLVTIIDPASEDTVSVKSGVYHLELKDPNSKAVVSPRQLTITRNERKKVSVTLTHSGGSETNDDAVGATGSENTQGHDLKRKIAHEETQNLIKDQFAQLVQMRKDGKFARAIEKWQEIPYVLNLEQSAARYLEIARCFKALEDYDLAIENYQQAISHSDDLEMYFEYAELLEPMDSDMAYKYYRQAYQIKPTIKKYADAYQRLSPNLVPGNDPKDKQAISSDDPTIKIGETIKISVYDDVHGSQIDDSFTVEPAGTVALGARYGRVEVAGLTWPEVEKTIKKHLETILTNPQVQVTAKPRWEHRTISLKHIKARDVVLKFQRQYPEVKARLQASQRSDSVLVSAMNRSDLEKVIALIESMDVATPATSAVGGKDPLDTQTIGPIGESLFDGKGLQHWRSVALRETKIERVLEAFDALTALLSEGNAEAIASTVFQTERRFGPGENYRVTGRLSSKSRQILSRCEPATIAGLMINEFGNEHGGNIRSRNFIRKCWYHSIYMPKSEPSRPDAASRETELWKILSENSAYFWNRAAELGSADDDTSWAASTQTLFMSLANPNRAFQLGDERLQVIAAEMRSLNPAVEEYTATSGGKAGLGWYELARKITACRALLRHSPAHVKEVLETMAHVIRDEASIHKNFRIGSFMVFQVIEDYPELSQPLAATLVDVLPRWISISDDLDSDGRTYIKSVGVYSSGAEKIIETLGNIGPPAKAAIPTLERITKLMRGQIGQKEAVDALKKIRATEKNVDDVEKLPGEEPENGHADTAS